MAKWWEYSAGRRNALIVVMWSLFGVSLAVAAALTSYQHGKLESVYAPPVPCGPFTVRVPLGWKVNPKPTGGAKLEAIEPVKLKRQNRPRRLLFIQKTVAAGTSSEDYAAQEPLLAGSSIFQDDDVSHLEPITIAGYPGLFFVRAYTKSVAIIATVPVVEYCGVVTTPDGQALAVKLICEGQPDEGDLPLLHSTLERIAVNDR